MDLPPVSRRRLRQRGSRSDEEVKRRPKHQLHVASPHPGPEAQETKARPLSRASHRDVLPDHGLGGDGLAGLFPGELPDPPAALPVPKLDSRSEGEVAVGEASPVTDAAGSEEIQHDDPQVTGATAASPTKLQSQELGEATGSEMSRKSSSPPSVPTQRPADVSPRSSESSLPPEGTSRAPHGDLDAKPSEDQEPIPQVEAVESSQDLILDLQTDLFAAKREASEDPGEAPPGSPASLPPASPGGRGAVGPATGFAATGSAARGTVARAPKGTTDTAPLRDVTEAERWRGIRSACSDFPFCTAHCPFLVALGTLVATPLLVILLWPGLVINSDTSVFLEADSRSSSIRSAFLGALPFREPEGGPAGPARRLMTGPMPPIDVRDMYKMDELVLYYSTTDPKGLLQEKYLRPMQQLELSLRNGPLYQRTCHEMTTPGLGVMCDPGHSVVNAAFPSEPVNVSETAAYVLKPMDGRGQQLLRPDVIQTVISTNTDYKELMLPRKYQEGDVIMKVRSFFGWNMLCCKIDVPASERSAELSRLRGIWDELLATEVLPKLVAFEQANRERQRDLQINFDGDGVSTMQLWDVLFSDCFFAIGSVLFIISYLTLHAGSPLLSCGSMLLTMMAIPIAFLVTALLSGSNEVTGAFFLSIFLITGLGADVVLVFINFWVRSKSTAPEPPTPAQSTAALGGADFRRERRQALRKSTAERVKYVYRHAGLACLGTTLTTAASFFANLASVLRALREFGFFMGMCILGAYIYLLLCLPALLILNDRCASLRCSAHCWELCTRWCPKRRCGAGNGAGICERLILAYRRSCFLFFLVLVVSFGFWTSSVARLDVGVPQMFPDGHNLNDVEDISEEFQEASERWTNSDLRICNFLVTEDRRDFMRCAIHQCQITLEGPLTFMGSADRNGTAECDCFPSELPSSDCSIVPAETQEGYILVRVRVVGDVPHEALESWRQSPEFRDYVKQAAIEANPLLRPEIEAGMTDASWRWFEPGPGHALEQEFWETGEAITTSYEVLPNFGIPIRRPNAVRLCHADRLCYCGAAMCTYPGRRLVDPVIPDVFFVQRMQFPISFRRLELTSGDTEVRGSSDRNGEPGSSVAVGMVPRRLQGGVDVSLVWGLGASDAMPLLGKAQKAWEFQAAFRMDAPSTQRQMWAACSLGEDKPELLVQETACWIKDFRSYALAEGSTFPVRSASFQNLFARFVDGRVLPSGVLVKDYMWLEEGFQLKATYVQFTVALNYMTAQTSRILSLMQEWDQVVDEINQNASPELGSTWHTSSLWIRAEAELAIVNSTLLTMLVSAMCGFLGALFFTHWDPLLSLMVVVNVIGVTLSLAWFMMVMMGWAVGVLEVLGLIVFVGYSITYTLHIAHKYQEHILSSESLQLGRQLRERRKRAVSYALRSMSGSIMGSAVTTLGSSFFLFFCQLVIFVKLATVLFSVTFFACLFATMAFPAALLCLGPVGTSCEQLAPQLWATCQTPGDRGHTNSDLSGPRVHSEAERLQLSSKLASKIRVDDGTKSSSHIFLASHSLGEREEMEKRPRAALRSVGPVGPLTGPGGPTDKASPRAADVAITVL